MVDNPDQAWVLYDAGPREVKCPLIFLPAVCGTADCFFKQILTLSAQGYRVISVRALQLEILFVTLVVHQCTGGISSVVDGRRMVREFSKID